MIKPVLEEIQADYDGKLNLVQMNTDENQVLCVCVCVCVQARA